MPLSMMATENQKMYRQVNAIRVAIMDLNENGKRDISARLKTYLRELCESGALRSVNFVEAAPSIQTPSGKFGNKVEYLWQLLIKVVESVLKEGAQGHKGNEQRKNAATVSGLLKDFNEISVTIDTSIWKGEGKVHLEPPIYSELVYNCPCKNTLSLFDPMLNPVGDKSCFRLNSAISESFVLTENLSPVDCGSGIEDLDDTDMVDGDGCTGDNEAINIDDALSKDLNKESSPPAEKMVPEPNIQLAEAEYDNAAAPVNAV